jgi:peptide/nickel transport system permease protein
MGRYLARRLLWALIMMWLVASMALLLGRLAGSDIIAQRLGIGAKRELVEAERHSRGLDRPLPVQYLSWLAGLARLDFGTSAIYGRPVGELVATATRNTALIATLAFLLAVLLGLPLGLMTGSRGGILSAAVRTLSVLLISAPPLLTSLLLVWLAALSRLAPIGGMTSSTVATTDAGFALDLLAHLPLPVLALALPFAATLERVQSEALARALKDPAVSAARARGVSRKALVWRHAWRLGAGPVVAVCGLMAGTLLSGSFAVELVTSWPGLGRLTAAAMYGRDIYLSAGCAMAATLLLSLGVVSADLVSALIDPRVLEFDHPSSGGAA